MTTDDLIPLLEQAGICQEVWFEHHRSIERFAALVAAAEREKVAAWMRSKSYATGHGDTIEDLLKELEWQVAEESAELLQALQNLHQRCHWADAPEEMDAAKAAIEKAIRARGET